MGNRFSEYQTSARMVKILQAARSAAIDLLSEDPKLEKRENALTKHHFGQGNERPPELGQGFLGIYRCTFKPVVNRSS